MLRSPPGPARILPKKSRSAAQLGGATHIPGERSSARFDARCRILDAFQEVDPDLLNTLLSAALPAFITAWQATAQPPKQIAHTAHPKYGPRVVYAHSQADTFSVGDRAPGWTSWKWGRESWKSAEDEVPELRDLRSVLQDWGDDVGFFDGWMLDAALRTLRITYGIRKRNEEVTVEAERRGDRDDHEERAEPDRLADPPFVSDLRAPKPLEFKANGWDPDSASRRDYREAAEEEFRRYLTAYLDYIEARARQDETRESAPHVKKKDRSETFRWLALHNRWGWSYERIGSQHNCDRRGVSAACNRIARIAGMTTHAQRQGISED